MIEKLFRDNEVLIDCADKFLEDLQAIVENVGEKRGEIFIEWMNTQNKYPPELFMHLGKTIHWRPNP